MKAQKKIQKYSLKDCVENEVRVMRPNLGLKCDYKGGRAAAIQIFCISCMGGDKNAVKDCKAYSCPLWQFRPGMKGRKKAPPGLPTTEQYKEMIEANISKKRREAGKKLNEH